MFSVYVGFIGVYRTNTVIATLAVFYDGGVFWKEGCFLRVCIVVEGFRFLRDITVRFLGFTICRVRCVWAGFVLCVDF